MFFQGGSTMIPNEDASKMKFIGNKLEGFSKHFDAELKSFLISIMFSTWRM